MGTSTKLKSEIIRLKEPYPGQPMMFNWPITSVDFNNLDKTILMKIPHTDCRLRPDQKALEYGDLKAARDEKFKLEEAQRRRRKFRETNNIEHKPKWFQKYEDLDSDDISYAYVGGYWERRFEYFRRNCKVANLPEPKKGRFNGRK